MTDTIAAIATAQGEGPIAIIRISGDSAKDVFLRAFRPRSGVIAPGKLQVGMVVDQDGAPVDEAMGVFLPAPHTYTREDVCEIQCHGGRVTVSRVLDCVLCAGARPAQPGEFTKRAFLNGRIDLSEAEAVMGMLGAQSDEAQKAQLRALTGGVSKKIVEWSQRVTDMLARIQAAIDFPDEVEEAEERDELRARLLSLIGEIGRATDDGFAKRLREGVQVALVGRPNTGKSSLLNALIGRDRAITSACPGTTRDVLTEELEIHGRLFVLTDTAGQRESDDPVERIGIERARRAQEDADIVLLVLDGSQPRTNEDISLMETRDDRYLVAVNKDDLPEAYAIQEDAILVSAKTGAGLETLKTALYAKSGGRREDAYLLTAPRQIALAREACDALLRAQTALEDGLPICLATIDLTDALNALLEVTGKNASAQVIDAIFRDFCVGK